MIQSRSISAVRVIRDLPKIVKENNKVKINDFIDLDDLFYNDNVQANAIIKMCELTDKIFTNLNNEEINDLKKHLIYRAYSYKTDKEFKIQEGKSIHYIQKDPTRKEGDISGNKFAIAKIEDVRLKFKLIEQYCEWLKTNDFDKKDGKNESKKNVTEIFDSKKGGITKQDLKLCDLITHDKNNEIVELIKISFKNIRGKQLKILLCALQELDLIPKERIAKKFHDCCTREFEWDVSSYPAMNDYKYNKMTDLEELNNKKRIIKSIIN